MQKTKIIITSQFEDETTRKFEIYPLSPSQVNITALKAKINEINAKIADPTDTTYNTFCQSWVSDDGANFKKFSEVTVETAEEREISLNI